MVRLLRNAFGAADVYEDRWQSAGARLERGRSPSVVKDLEGDWRVVRLTGPVPMAGLWKRVSGTHGDTRGWWGSLGIPFKLEQLEGHVALIYEPPFSFMVDELRLQEDGSWLGRAYAAGVRYAWFRMVPIDR